MPERPDAPAATRYERRGGNATKLRDPLGWRVHHWEFPIVLWVRRNPRSRFRQAVWYYADRIDWHLRVRPMLRRLFRGR